MIDAFKSAYDVMTARWEVPVPVETWASTSIPALMVIPACEINFMFSRISSTPIFILTFAKPAKFVLPLMFALARAFILISFAWICPFLKETCSLILGFIVLSTL